MQTLRWQEATEQTHYKRREIRFKADSYIIAAKKSHHIKIKMRDRTRP